MGSLLFKKKKKRNSVLLYKIANLTNLAIKELKTLARARNMNVYENNSKQQLRSLYIVPSSPISAQIPAPRFKKHPPTSAPRSKKPLPINTLNDY